MVMRVVYNKIIPFGRNFLTINLFGVLFTKGRLDADMIRHEKIHTAQMKELLFLPFYILYFFEWLVRLLQYGRSTKAYYNISFEREAYRNMRNPDYLSCRKRFAFLHYLKIPNKEI